MAIDRKTRAFPFPYAEMHTDGEVYDFGMTLRDYFAAAAMNAVLSRESTKVSYDDNKRIIAQCAFDVADAMIEARKIEKYATAEEAIAAAKEKQNEKI